MLRKLICLVGLILCGYLLYLTEFVGLCLGHCDPTNYSLGIAWFLAGAILRSEHAIRKVNLLKAWGLLGVLGVGYFMVREVFEGFCFYCTIIHVIALSCVACTFLVEERSLMAWKDN